MASLPFVIPAAGNDVRDLEFAREGRICVKQPIQINSLSVAEQGSCLDTLTISLESQSQDLEQDTLDGLYSFVRFFKHLSKDTKGRFIDLLCDTVSPSAPDASPPGLNVLKAGLYFISTLLRTNQETFEVVKAAMPTGRGAKKNAAPALAANDIDWPEFRRRLLIAMTHTLVTHPVNNKRSQQPRVWHGVGDSGAGVVDESTAAVYWSAAETLLQTKNGYANDSDHNVLLHLVAASTHRFHQVVAHSVVSALSHGIRRHEHMAKAAVSVLQVLCAPVSKGGYDDDRVPRELLLEIGRSSMGDQARDSEGMKNVSIFIEELAPVLPKLLMSNLSVLHPYLGHDAYRLRCSIIVAFAHLIRYYRSQQQQQQQQQSEDNNDSEEGAGDPNRIGQEESARIQEKLKITRDSLVLIISERTTDVNSFVRAAALKAMAELCVNNALPLASWDVVVDLGMHRLYDNKSTVRKHAVVLLGTLMENNPFNSQLDPNIYAKRVEVIKGEIVRLAQEEEKEREEKAAALEAKQLSTDMAKKLAIRDDDGSKDGDDESELDMEEEEQEEQEQEEASVYEKEQQKRTKALEYCKSAMIFIVKIERATIEMQQLLLSKNVSDVLEALRFLCKAHKFGIPGAQDGIRAALVLVWDSRETGTVKKELLESIENLYMKSDGQGGHMMGKSTSSTGRKLLAPREIALNLVNLVKESTLAELTSLECILAEFMKAKGVLKRQVLAAPVLDAVWDLVTVVSPAMQNSEQTSDLTVADTAENTRAALCVLGLVASENAKVVDQDSHVQLLIDCMSVRTDPELRRYALVALHNAIVAAAESSGLKKHELAMRPSKARLTCLAMRPSCDSMCTRLVDIVTEEPSDWKLVNTYEQNQWFSAAEQAITVLFDLASRPERECEMMLKRMYSKLLIRRDSNGDEARNGHRGCINAAYLTRVLFVVGHVAVKLLVYCETLTGAIKAFRSEEEQNPSAAKIGNNIASASNGSGLLVGGGGGGEHSDDDGFDDESDGDLQEMAGGSGGDEVEEMLLRRVGEEELTMALDNILGMATPLLLRIVAKKEVKFGLGKELGVATSAFVDLEIDDDVNDGEEEKISQEESNNTNNSNKTNLNLRNRHRLKETEQQLRAAAILTLCKLMSVSDQFCEKHLQLLFTVLRDEPNQKIRGNIIVALGDLAFRFPNTVEPFTSQIYKRLRDNDTMARKNTLMVLSHLILNDMVKVRGEVSEIAACITDEDERIQDLAKLFFTELGKKEGNPVYNLLPDVSGGLSRNPAVNAEDYKTIIKFLFGFVTEEKHKNALAERFCGRVQSASGANSELDDVDTLTAPGIQQCRDFAFCLEQLKLSDKLVVKLTDQLYKLYRPVLGDRVIYGSFVRVAKRAIKKLTNDKKKESSAGAGGGGAVGSIGEKLELIAKWEERMKEEHERLKPHGEGRTDETEPTTVNSGEAGENGEQVKAAPLFSELHGHTKNVLRKVVAAKTKSGVGKTRKRKKTKAMYVDDTSSEEEESSGSSESESEEEEDEEEENGVENKKNQRSKAAAAKTISGATKGRNAGTRKKNPSSSSEEEEEEEEEEDSSSEEEENSSEDEEVYGENTGDSSGVDEVEEALNDMTVSTSKSKKSKSNRPSSSGATPLTERTNRA